MTIRTTRFAGGHTSATTEIEVYEVPAGHRVLVRGVNYVNNRSAATTVYLGVRVGSGGALVSVDQGPSISSFTGTRADPWVVANAGDVLTITAPSGSGDFYYSIAGVLFDL